MALKQLEHERFVMLSRECRASERDCHLGIHPEIAHAVRQRLTIIAMVANRFGITVVPRSLVRTRVHGMKFVAQVRAPAMLVRNPAYCPRPFKRFIGCSAKVLTGAEPRPGETTCGRVASKSMALPRGVKAGQLSSFGSNRIRSLLKPAHHVCLRSTTQ